MAKKKNKKGTQIRKQAEIKSAAKSHDKENKVDDQTNRADAKNDKCDIFISYRRDGGDLTAKFIYDELEKAGYSVFMDVEKLSSGKFNTKLLARIEECTDFLLVLPPHALDRCSDPKDWVRIEVEHAIQANKNIIPISLRGFNMPEKEALPESMRGLPDYNRIEANNQNFKQEMSRLISFLHSKNKAKKFKDRLINLFSLRTITMTFLGIGFIVIAILAGYYFIPHQVSGYTHLPNTPVLSGMSEKYDGTICRRRPQGEGRLEINWNDGLQSFYVGEFDDGIPCGKGTYTNAKGESFTSDEWRWLEITPVDEEDREHSNVVGLTCDGENLCGLGFEVITENKDWASVALQYDDDFFEVSAIGEWANGYLNGYARFYPAIDDYDNYNYIDGIFEWVQLEQNPETNDYYTGYIVDGDYGGFGTLIYADNDIYSYSGFFKDGIPYLKGCYTYPPYSGDKYMSSMYLGELDSIGNPTGEGYYYFSNQDYEEDEEHFVIASDWDYDDEYERLEILNGQLVSIVGDNHYIGMTLDKKEYGYGNGDVLWNISLKPHYIGDWKDGQPYGAGRYNFSEDSYCFGSINFYPSGEGGYHFSNGDILRGNISVEIFNESLNEKLNKSDFEFKGWGTVLTIDGNLNGYGIWDFSSSGWYSGEWRDNRPCGKGSLCYFFDNSNDYELFENDFWTWETIEMDGGAIYEGMAINKQATGYGILYEEGRTIEGTWKNGVCHGIVSVTENGETNKVVCKDGVQIGILND